MVLKAEGLEKVFGDIFNKNYQALCLYAAKLIGNFEEAEDLVQEVFVRFWEVFQANQEMASVRAYLYRMTRNTCIDRTREQKIDRVDAEMMADKLEYYFQPESEEDSKMDLLLEAVNALPEKCREVFVDICVNNLRYKEVADKMDISVNTVKTQLSRAIKLLRESLNRDDFKLFLTFFSISR